MQPAIRRRRNDMPSVSDEATVGEITIRPDLYQAYADSASLELTAREFELLHLLSQAGRVLRREEIYERVGGYAMAHGDRFAAERDGGMVASPTEVRTDVRNVAIPA